MNTKAIVYELRQLEGSHQIEKVQNVLSLPFKTILSFLSNRDISENLILSGEDLLALMRVDESWVATCYLIGMSGEGDHRTNLISPAFPETFLVKKGSFLRLANARLL